MRTGTYAWRLLKAIPGNHKWFLDENTGRLAVADYSGHLPDQTDDGVMWLDTERPIQLGQCPTTRAINLATPVICEGPFGDRSHIGSGVAETMYLIQNHGMRLECLGTTLGVIPDTGG